MFKINSNILVIIDVIEIAVPIIGVTLCQCYPIKRGNIDTFDHIP